MRLPVLSVRAATRRRAVAAVLTVAAAAGFAVPTLAGPVGTLPCITQVSQLNSKCELWARAYNDPSPDGSAVNNRPGGIAVDRSGQHVFIASTDSTGSGQPHVTLARLSAATGATQWSVRPNTHLTTTAVSLRLTPDDREVVLIAQLKYLPNLNASPVYFWLTSAFAASNGRQLWASVYNTGGEINVPVDLRISSRGDRVFVTGYSVYGGRQRPFVEWVTISYRLSDGQQQWLSRYEGVAGGQNFAVGLVLSPRSDVVYVVGTSDHPQDTGVFSNDYAVVAYDARSGHVRWREIARLGSDNWPAGIAIDASGAQLYVGGSSVFGTTTSPVGGAAAYALNAHTGKLSWATHYLPPQGQSASSFAIVVAGSRVFLAAGAGQRQAIVPAAAQPLVGNPLQPSAEALDVLAIDRSSGHQLWLTSYSPDPEYSATPTSMIVNAQGSMLYIAGTVGPPTLLAGYPVTVAVTTSGKQAWVARYDVRDPTSIGAGVAGFPAQTVGIVADAAGHRVFTNVDFDPPSVGGVNTACRAANSAGTTQQCSHDDEADLVLGYAP